MEDGRPPDHDSARREGERAIARASAEGDLIGGATRAAARHFAGADADPADPIEVWGRRIGRALSLAFLILLLLWIGSAYL